MKNVKFWGIIHGIVAVLFHDYRMDAEGLQVLVPCCQHAADPWQFFLPDLLSGEKTKAQQQSAESGGICPGRGDIYRCHYHYPLSARYRGLQLQ